MTRRVCKARVLLGLVTPVLRALHIALGTRLGLLIWQPVAHARANPSLSTPPVPYSAPGDLTVGEKEVVMVD